MVSGSLAQQGRISWRVPPLNPQLAGKARRSAPEIANLTILESTGQQPVPKENDRPGQAITSCLAARRKALPVEGACSR